MKTCAIVPAYNEGKNVQNVLRVLLDSHKLDEVMMVDDGSSDNTAEAGRQTGARVLALQKNGGKANAMRQGIEATDADVIVFFDADLISLKPEHISPLIDPILRNEVEMCVGLRGRAGGLPKLMARIAPVMCVIGGERAMRREIFLGVPQKFMKGFSVEIALNYFCKTNKLRVKLVELPGLTIIIKEKKWGFWKGFKSRVRMSFQLFTVRIAVSFHKKDFLKKHV